MPRNARLVLPNYPHHIVHRGRNGQPIFHGDDDYRYFLANLIEWKTRLKCKLYSFCLLPDHLHLIIDPGEQPQNLAKLMKRLAGRHTRYINTINKQQGQLWQSRYKSSPLQLKRYLLPCSRYIDLHPVRSALCSSPESYPWSSFRYKVGLKHIDWLDFDLDYLALGSTRKERAGRYRAYLSEPISLQENNHIRDGLQRERLTGDEKLALALGEQYGRDFLLRKVGRPRSR